MGANRRLRRSWNAGILALVAVAGLGCGKNRVIVDVDVRSFMDQSQLVHDYDAPPAVPVSTRLGDIPINLVEGFKDFGEAETATMDIGLQYDNQTGTGRGRFIIYFSDDPATLFDTPAVATVDADLIPTATTNGTVQIQADARVLALFTEKHFWMGVDMQWEPEAGDPLQGTLNIAQIQVRVVSTLGLFD